MSRIVAGLVAVASGLAAGLGNMGAATDRASDAVRQIGDVSHRTKPNPAQPANHQAGINHQALRRFGASTAGYGGVGGIGGVHGPAGTNRQYQRAALKRRNAATNRRAHRRAG